MRLFRIIKGKIKSFPMQQRLALICTNWSQIRCCQKKLGCPPCFGDTVYFGKLICILIVLFKDSVFVYAHCLFLC